MWQGSRTANAPEPQREPRRVSAEAEDGHSGRQDYGLHGQRRFDRVGPGSLEAPADRRLAEVARDHHGAEHAEHPPRPVIAAASEAGGCPCLGEEHGHRGGERGSYQERVPEDSARITAEERDVVGAATSHRDDQAGDPDRELAG